MTTRYTVASFETRYEEDACTNASRKRGKRRIDVFKLALASRNMPACRAVLESRLIHASAIESVGMELASSIRSITLRANRDDGSADPYAQADFLTATCPYCRRKEKLEHAQWRVCLDSHCASGLVACDSVSNGPDKLSRYFADYPTDWDDCANARLVPLASYADEIEQPYGEQLPLHEFAVDLAQLQLPPFAEERFGGRSEYGRTGGYKGIYVCQHCDLPYYVVYHGTESDHIASPRGLWQHCAPAPLGGATEVEATVISDSDAITVQFSPEPKRVPKSIRFDLSRGFTEVDGVQLLKNDEHSGDDLGLLLPGFSCEKLLAHIASLMDERNGRVARVLELVGVSRRRNRHLPTATAGKSFIDLAIANRFHNYPDAFYLNLFTQRSEWEKDLMGLVPFAALPVLYEDVPRVFDMSGLPSCKSIRRLAFGQPLFISYAHRLRQMPFDDPNILASLLSHEKALAFLELLEGAEGDTTVFEYLKESREDLAVWRYLKRLMNDGFLDDISTGGYREALDAETTRMVDALPIGKASSALAAVFKFHRQGRSVFDDYDYTSAEWQLRGTAGGFDFELPRNPLEMTLAGEELGNCLASYADRLSKQSTTIVVARRGNKLVGAFEVLLEEGMVMQARARFNDPLSSCKGLREACESWANEKGLGLDSTVLE